MDKSNVVSTIIVINMFKELKDWKSCQRADKYKKEPNGTSRI